MLDMLKTFWNSFEWQGKVVLVSIPIALFVYATTDFPPPNCDHRRAQLQLALNETTQYRDQHVYFQRGELQNCIAVVAANAKLKAAESVDPWHVARRTNAASGYQTFWLVLLIVVLPLGCLLSYAHAAGRWGNAAYVKWSDFYGLPLGLFVSVAFFIHATLAVDMMQTGVALSQTTKAVFVGSILCTFVFALPMMFMLGADFVRELWTMTKGLAMLAHYAFAQHPAELVLPDTPDVPINRKALRDALTDRYTEAATGGTFWSAFKPRFMYEHELFRANKVEELLRADTTILQEAIRRERARADHADQKRA